MKLCQTCYKLTADEHSFCAHDGKPLVTDPLATALQGSLGAKYSLTKLIGTGSMGAVYRARHQALDDVAIKVMLGPPDNHKLSQRFLREARALRKLHNQHSVLVYDLERSATGLTYMVMEMVEGRSLRDILRERGYLSLEETMEVAEAVCDALSAAHEQGIIHRDLKPDNVLIAEEKTVEGQSSRIIKIADFGIAKLRGTREGGVEVSMQLTQHGAPIGTPFYMSPEQWFGDGPGFTALDGRTDIYSLGCTLYEMLAGEPPFVGTTTDEMRRKHLKDVPRPLNEIAPHVPEAFSHVILRSLEKDRDLRPATAEEFATELRRAYEESSPAATATASPAVAPPVPSKVSESSVKAGPVSQLQSTEETVPVVRNWSAREVQRAIEQVREFQGAPETQTSPPPKNEEASRPIVEPFADTLEDFEDTFSPGTPRIELDSQEFQQTLSLKRDEQQEQKVASPEEKPQSGGTRLMTARVGTKLIGILADEVETVADWSAPVPLPHAPPAVLGVVQLRGRMLTVLDPLALLGAGDNGGITFAPRFLIALRGDEQLALAVSQVDGAIEADLQEVWQTDEGVEAGAVRSTALIPEGPVTVLETRELFDAATRGTERRRQRT